VKVLNLYSNDNFNLLRNQIDPLSDGIIPLLIQQPEWAVAINQVEHISQLPISEFPKQIQQFLNFYTTKPHFIQEEKIKLAQEFFNKNGSLYLTLLGLYSLPYCYAFADGAQVLYRSQRITNDIGNRLAETALFVLEAFQPGLFILHDQGMMSILKVRLIHSYGRFLIQKHSKDWNPHWGHPINQEDLLGTNLAFSLLVLRGFNKLKRKIDQETFESILHYWKVLGHYLGLQIDYWPTTSKEAFELEKLIRKRHLKSSREGKLLLKGLMQYLVSEMEGSPSLNQIESIIAYFLDEDASEALGLKHQLIIPPFLLSPLFNFNFNVNNPKDQSYLKVKQEFFERYKKDIQLQIPVIRS
jgi:hypothetical protein